MNRVFRIFLPVISAAAIVFAGCGQVFAKPEVTGKADDELYIYQGNERFYSDLSGKETLVTQVTLKDNTYTDVEVTDCVYSGDNVYMCINYGDGGCIIRYDIKSKTSTALYDLGDRYSDGKIAYHSGDFSRLIIKYSGTYALITEGNILSEGLEEESGFSYACSDYYLFKVKDCDVYYTTWETLSDGWSLLFTTDYPLYSLSMQKDYISLTTRYSLMVESTLYTENIVYGYNRYAISLSGGDIPGFYRLSGYRQNIDPNTDGNYYVINSYTYYAGDTYLSGDTLYFFNAETFMAEPVCAINTSAKEDNDKNYYVSDVWSGRYVVFNGIITGSNTTEKNCAYYDLQEQCFYDKTPPSRYKPTDIIVENEDYYFYDSISYSGLITSDVYHALHRVNKTTGQDDIMYVGYGTAGTTDYYNFDAVRNY